jgi:peptidyl-dipeptidase Dcp
MPFLQFSPNRELRRQAQQAWANRGARGGDTDNRAIAAESINLRHEMAQLLGYENFAAYKLETEMAKNSDNVRQLLMDVWKPAKTQALVDQDILAQMMRADGVEGPLQPWDWRYYSEKRRQAEHDLDEELVKPYFQLDRMIDAAFDCANRLFGLEFAPVDVPLYHPDCRAWAVTRGGDHIAIFIGDYFARGSKRSGAWCSAIQAQAKFPDVKSPIVVNVCNFAKDKPALLSADDVRTLFHEFGHALHQMLSNVTYEMVSGTSVPRDFVELPSQLYEHWAMVPEVMQKHALHCETGEPIPQDLLDRVIGAQNYDMGFSTVEFIASAIVDLEYHQGPLTDDVMDRQAEILRDMGMPEAIEMRHATPHFAHVFSGGYYASAYYSYMWAEVMDADAFEAFAELQNPFDPATAASLERNILSTGGSRDPEELYTTFRGRLPQVDALLKGRGLAG